MQNLANQLFTKVLLSVHKWTCNCDTFQFLIPYSSNWHSLLASFFNNQFHFPINSKNLSNTQQTAFEKLHAQISIIYKISVVSCHFKRAEFIFQTKKFPFTIIVCIFYLLPSAFFLLLFNLCFTKYGDRIIVHIRWRLGNLKKTYLGDPQHQT